MHEEEISIHALLAESDLIDLVDSPIAKISIHALLAESDDRAQQSSQRHHPISIHALLAESDPRSWPLPPKTRYFYPRSPCGERPVPQQENGQAATISIHALLAESDTSRLHKNICGWGFLSTLSLRRATNSKINICYGDLISIHALLAESDSRGSVSISRYRNFYPRSPCGERRGPLWIECRHPLFLSTLSLRRATFC